MPTVYQTLTFDMCIRFALGQFVLIKKLGSRDSETLVTEARSPLAPQNAFQIYISCLVSLLIYTQPLLQIPEPF